MDYVGFKKWKGPDSLMIRWGHDDKVTLSALTALIYGNQPVSGAN